MRLTLEVAQREWRTGEAVTVRLLAVNDSYETASVDRRLLIGPNPVPAAATGVPFPVSVEPAFEQEDQNRVLLNPWCIYGRERTFDNLPPGKVALYGYLLRRASQSTPPQGPGEADALLAAAEPVELTIQDRG
jgi:hypothetical protein